jgi:hypothetical protein
VLTYKVRPSAKASASDRRSQFFIKVPHNNRHKSASGIT